MGRALACLLLCAHAACGARATPAPEGEEARFHAEAEAFYWKHFEFRPHDAVELGQHRFDGRLPDRSAAGLAGEIERLHHARTSFEAYDPTRLSPLASLEREILLNEIRGKLFDLEVRREPWRNPMFYSEELDLSPYVIRPYAPVAERAKALLSVCAEAPRYLAEARANLEKRLAVSFLDTAILQVKGHIEFARDDVPKAMVGLDAARAKELTACMEDLAEELSSFRDFLDSRHGEATADFALGERGFLRMLEESQGVKADFASLEKLAQADLDRNLAAMAEAAKAIDPTHSTREVVLAQAEDRLLGREMLAEASKQAEAMRKFIVDKQIVSIPSDLVAEVRESPPFMRWNAAFLDPVGPFEAGRLTSFYYISPPDPTWPPAEQKAYLIPRADLLFTTIHEVWPGHFLQHLHIAKSPSPIVKSFCTYSTSEGWAHYVEEMMFEQGAGGGDPRAHIGQLKEALLRNVRFVSALGLHGRAMTVEYATRLFMEKGFVDAANARQQAVRGTFDPMYLSYTVGKLILRKLYADWKAKREAAGQPARLKAFHDEVLSYGCAPLPVIRTRMLGPDAGPVL